MDYGITEEDKHRPKADSGSGKADKNGEGNHHEVTKSDRDGDQGQAGAYHSDVSDSPIKDTRQWRTKTKEQAQ